MQLNKPPKFPRYFVENTLKIFQVVFDGETLTKTYESATQAWTSTRHVIQKNL